MTSILFFINILGVMGDSMVYSIKEGSETSILGYNIIVNDLLYLLEDDCRSIILDIINNSQILRTFNFPKHVIDLIEDAIINDRDIEYLRSELTDMSVPLYSLIISLVNTHKTKYNKLLEMKNSDYIEIECNKNNFIKALEIAKRLNKRVVIEGKSISLSEYQKLLSDYDIDSLNGYDIKINYQMQNHDVDVRGLYDISVCSSQISSKIEKYNLSPLEKIIYVYDEVKKREYKKSDKDIYESRDLDRVLHSDAIVCVGYSNLFNAILKNLGIKAIPLLSISARHQRSLVYIEDSKYNINGVYVFDPTFDSKKNEKYIDKYNYFGIRLGDSEKDCPSELYKYTRLSFSELLRIYNSDDKEDLETSVDIMHYMRYLFGFIKFDYEKFNEGVIYYDFSREDIQRETEDIYSDFILKYNPKVIGADTFMMALYNTRMIEFYEGKVEDFDIDSVKEASKNRSINQMFNYSDKEDIIEKMFESIRYSDSINTSLGKLIHYSSNDMKKNKQNIRLLKVLKNSKKDK